MSKDDGGKFFPGDFGESSTFTIRDYFAAKAMQSFIERGADACGFGDNYVENNLRYAKVSYCMADAMLEARKK